MFVPQGPDTNTIIFDEQKLVPAFGTDWPLTNGFCSIYWINLNTDIYTAKAKSTLQPLI